MRKSKHTKDEILEAERLIDDRKRSRKTGFDMMKIRDRGWHRFDNGVVMEWPVDKEQREDGVLYTNIPEGHFLLHVGNDTIAFDADEFQKFVRWV